jgi:hypothetical protein
MFWTWRSVSASSMFSFPCPACNSAPAIAAIAGNMLPMNLLPLRSLAATWWRVNVAFAGSGLVVSDE